MDYPKDKITEFNTVSETGVHVSSTTGGTQVLASNSARVYARLKNVGTYRMVISNGKTPDKSRGILLERDEVYEMKPDTLWRGAVKAISNTVGANQTMMVEEGYVA